MYYRMGTDRRILTAFVEKKSGPAIFALTIGSHYDAEADELPFRFSFRDPEKQPLLDFIGGDCLMSRRLVETLEGAGVDNLQKFEAELHDETSGEINRYFYVVNVVGLVAAADLSKSKSLPLGGGHVFTDLTVDPSKTQGLLVFRLAESLIDIIVHERVAKAIEAGKFHGVLLTPVSPD